MNGDPLERDHDPTIGRPEPLAPGLVAVTAPNAGPMTFTGTRSYILGKREIAVIDPGPEDAAHRDALLAAVPAGGRVTAILVTHAHRDHSAGARALGARLDAPVFGFGARPRSAVMERLAATGTLGGGEGIDPDFVPDRRLADGEVLAGTGWRIEALHTPGHLGDHLCFAWAEGGALFSGDLVMGWATTLISPPDGEIGAFLASLDRLAARAERTYYPGHGAPIRDPRSMVRLAAHPSHGAGRAGAGGAIAGACTRARSCRGDLRRSRPGVAAGGRTQRARPSPRSAPARPRRP